MRRMALVVLLLMGLVVGGVAFADGPSGSNEGGPDGTGQNDVNCGESTASVLSLNLYANVTTADRSRNGVEACDETGTAGSPQGRIIVSRNQYTSIDGDKDNNERAQGFIRIDGGGVGGAETRNGVICGDDNGAKDSTSPDYSNDTIEDCAP